MSNTNIWSNFSKRKGEFDHLKTTIEHTFSCWYLDHFNWMYWFLIFSFKWWINSVLRKFWYLVRHAGSFGTIETRGINVLRWYSKCRYDRQTVIEHKLPFSNWWILWGRKWLCAKDVVSLLEKLSRWILMPQRSPIKMGLARGWWFKVMSSYQTGLFDGEIAIEAIDSLPLSKELQLIDELDLKDVWVLYDVLLVINRILSLNYTHLPYRIYYAKVIHLLGMLKILGIFHVSRDQQDNS